MTYILCISKKGYEVSLEPRKLYVKIRDTAAERRGYVRIRDESGEDYLFPADHFTPMQNQWGQTRLKRMAHNQVI